jgi:hypothetical protein
MMICTAYHFTSNQISLEGMIMINPSMMKRSNACSIRIFASEFSRGERGGSRQRVALVGDAKSSNSCLLRNPHEGGRWHLNGGSPFIEQF